MLAAVNSQIILVVSDDPEARNYLEMALRCEGFGMETIERNQEALQYLRNGAPVCALLLRNSAFKPSRTARAR